jgi:hypothetical protein
MKVIIKESQVDMVFNHFKQIANKVGYFEALRSLKFPFSAANIFLKPKNEEYFTPKELTEIMYYYVFYAKQIPSRIEYKNFIIENRETESQGFYWDTDILKNSKLRSTTESCFGYAQPFWESEEVAGYFGRLPKMLLVGRFDFYTRGDWANPDEDYIEEDQFHKSYNFDMSGLKFKTLDEAKNWYLNEYPKIVIEFAEDFFENAKIHNKNR